MRWCAAVFVIAVILGNVPAPLIINFLKPVEEGTTELTWTSGLKEHISLIDDSSKSAPSATVTTTFPGARDEDTRTIDIDNATGPDGQVFFFPFEPQRRSVKYWDAYGQTSGVLDYVGPGEGQPLSSPESYVFSGSFSGEDYEAERTVEVDAKTGKVLDMTWTHDGIEDRLTPETVAALEDDVVPEHRLLLALQILALTMRLVAIIALVWGVVLFVRRR